MASETCALDLMRAEYVREVEPGEMVVISDDGMRSLQSVPARAEPKRCVFEYVYFARPDSLLFGRNVYQVRKELGRELARECPVEADIVVPVPDSGIAAALGYAEESGLPFEMGLIRSHYVGRTFIEPRQSIRHFGVKIKLNPVAERAATASAWWWSTTRSCAAPRCARSSRCCGRRARARCTCGSRAADHQLLLLRHRHADPRGADRLAATRSRRSASYITADSLGYLSWDGLYSFLDGAARGLLRRLLHRPLSGRDSGRITRRISCVCSKPPTMRLAADARTCRGARTKQNQLSSLKHPRSSVHWRASHGIPSGPTGLCVSRHL